MQNMDTREMKKMLEQYDYRRVRSNGSSHVIYVREATVNGKKYKDSISIPTNSKTISGPMAKRLTRQIQEFEKKISKGFSVMQMLENKVAVGLGSVKF